MRLFSRAKPQGQRPGPTELVAGIHRSPGLKHICDRLRAHPEPAVLDLGPSSTDNLAFFSELGANVQIQDLFRSCGGEYGSRIDRYTFPDVAEMGLPEEGDFDAILFWDLLHYFDRPQIAALMARLQSVIKPGGEVHVIASATAPIPPTPMQFRVVDAEQLEYQVFSESRMPPPELKPRVVEQLLPGFRPNRLFQLRNGLQEFLFTFEGPPETASSL